MKNIFLTGASSGIGKAILEMLLEDEENFIYAISRNIQKIEIVDEKNKRVEKINCDLYKLDELEKVLHSLKNIDFNIIINAAGVGFFSLHEEMNIAKIKNMISVNLQAPLIICQFFLRNLKKNRGTIINISSITAKKSSSFGLVYSATKAGLSHFSKGLFDEVRKYGVKVVCIHPDMTSTNFFEKQSFDCDTENHLAYIKASQIAETIKFILDRDENTVISEINIQPQILSIKKKR